VIHQELIVKARRADQAGVVQTARERSDGTCVPRTVLLDRCPYCQSLYRSHPGYADHRDQCELRPMNRPHIIGTANALSIDGDKDGVHS